MELLLFLCMKWTSGYQLDSLQITLFFRSFYKKLSMITIGRVPNYEMHFQLSGNIGVFFVLIRRNLFKILQFLSYLHFNSKNFTVSDPKAVKNFRVWNLSQWKIWYFEILCTAKFHAWESKAMKDCIFWILDSKSIKNFILWNLREWKILYFWNLQQWKMPWSVHSKS